MTRCILIITYLHFLRQPLQRRWSWVQCQRRRGFPRPGLPQHRPDHRVCPGRLLPPHPTHHQDHGRALHRRPLRRKVAQPRQHHRLHQHGHERDPENAGDLWAAGVRIKFTHRPECTTQCNRSHEFQGTPKRSYNKAIIPDKHKIKATTIQSY